MTFSQKKEKLYRYKKLLQKKKALDEDLKEFETRALTKAAHITPGETDKIKTLGGKNDLNKIAAYAERDEIYKLKVREKKKTEDEMLNILISISSIDNLDFQNAVYCYFILDMTYAEISFQYHISESTARWRRDRGIEEIIF